MQLASRPHEKTKEAITRRMVAFSPLKQRSVAQNVIDRHRHPVPTRTRISRCDQSLHDRHPVANLVNRHLSRISGPLQLRLHRLHEHRRQLWAVHAAQVVLADGLALDAVDGQLAQ
jgi:hypothetical protein